MKLSQAYLPLVGRILLALIFVLSGFGKIGGWQGYKAIMVSRGVPLVTVALVVSIIVEIAGGLSLFAGFKARVWSFILFLYLIPVSLTMHNFWAYAGMERLDQQIHFMKNISIMGGLLMVAAFGPGRLSVDARGGQSTAA